MAVYSFRSKFVEVLNVGHCVQVRLIEDEKVSAVYECYSLIEVMEQMGSIGKVFVTSPEEWKLVLSDNELTYFKAKQAGLL